MITEFGGGLFKDGIEKFGVERWCSKQTAKASTTMAIEARSERDSDQY
jgi:hypothetical protein